MENKKYSLLIVALYCYSGHIKGLIDHLKEINPLVDITLLTDKAEEMKNALTDKTVKIEWYDVAPVSYKQPWLKFLAIKRRQRSFFSKFSKGRKYDIVSVHFANKYMSFVYKDLRKMSDCLVMFPWGSDVLRIPKKNLRQLSSLYKKADYIAAWPDLPLGKKIMQEFNIDSTKLVGSFWGSDVVDYAIEHGDSISQETAKERFGLTGRYVITCGYNPQSAQQHMAIIAAIDQVRNQLPSNMTLLFPMTYSGNLQLRQPYIKECKDECSKRDLNAVFLTDFLSVEDVYRLRKATDMFVHVQTTDVSSSSVKEYILCNKKIVHGSWVKYEALEAFQPLFYFPVDKLEDLGDVIVKACHAENIAIPQGVIDYVKSSGWNNRIIRMNDFFMSIV